MSMSSFDDFYKKIRPIIFMLDISGHMHGESIRKLNAAMRSIISVLKERLEDQFLDQDVNIGVLTYSTYPEWLTPALTSVKDFYWDDVTADGVSNITAALDEINRIFMRRDLFCSKRTYCIPLIICMSDGFSIDDWKPALERCRMNKRFAVSEKVAFVFSDYADTEVLREFCGSEDRVISMDDVEQSVERIIQFISLNRCELQKDVAYPSEIMNGIDIASDVVWDDMESENIERSGD